MRMQKFENIATVYTNTHYSRKCFVLERLKKQKYMQKNFYTTIAQKKIAIHNRLLNIHAK